MSVDEYRAVSRAQWEGVAGGWERYAERLDTGAAGQAAEWLLDAAAPAPGAEVLELACGPGGVGLRAAEQVGPEGRVVCTDFAAPMVDVAARRAAERKLKNVETRVLDAESMDLPDAAFDAVLCRFGYMLMADPVAALAETHRVLRPGGHVALAVWAEPEANPWLMSLARPVMEHFDAPPPDPEAPGIFALAGAERLTGMLDAAGFDEVRTERLEAIERHDSPDAWWDYIRQVAGPLAGLLAAMADEDRERVRAAAYALAEEHRDGDEVAFPAAVRVAAAGRR